MMLCASMICAFARSGVVRLIPMLRWLLGSIEGCFEEAVAYSFSFWLNTCWLFSE
ncbi:hypothetical protein Tsubulata_035685 [Turnera subulata]|uniref:Uncharacterized protein n=1 Tax=Turnera subulata TaxID=218843 RepID=A0A9Q0J132_9ROSI|nr:hypothetical protein Tsubulata_035685 [Turnera subulata]